MRRIALTTAEPLVYLDSSALVKLVIDEGETPALRQYLTARPAQASSALAKVELVRNVRPYGDLAMIRARRLLQQLRLIAVDDALLDDAARIAGPTLRTLDAIHVAAARAILLDLEALVTYDRRMAEAARALGIEVASPS